VFKEIQGNIVYDYSSLFVALQALQQ